MTNGALIALANKLGGGGGGGSSVTVESLNVTANNTYTAPSGKAYSPVTVNVPDTPAVVAELTATSNGIYTASGGVDGYSPVTVSVAPNITALEATHNGIYTAPSGTDGYSPVTVNVSGGGGGSGSLSDQVRFFDYDGTLVGSYSKADFNALTAMPANPSHTGLTAQGWNWTLAQAKAQLTAVPDGVLNIGQMYTTSDGKTRLYIHIDDDTPSNRMNFFVRFKSSTANNVSLDWGDGTVDTKGSTSATNYEHTYSATGDYVITLTVNSGTIEFIGSSNTAIYGSTGNSYSYNRGRIRKVEIGDKVTSIGTYAFYYCYSITSITIPSGVTSIGISAFQHCYFLPSITIPSNVTSIGSNAFQNCYSLPSITIPSGATSIGNSAFQSCYSLTSITIPSNVTSIVNYAFQNCYGVGEYHLKPTTPPTLANTNAFSGIVSDCIIYVPYSADHSVLNNYKTAQNWSTYADYMVEEAA